MERLTKVTSCPDGTKIYDISNNLFGLNASRADKTRMVLEKLATYEDAEEQGLPIRWIPVDEKLPDVDEYIIVSFENFTVPMIGRYTVDDDDSGTFRIGDEDESFVENDLYVIAWMPLPKPYRESEA